MKIRSKKLNRAVDNFVEVMKQRLAEKEKEGYAGWDNPKERSNNYLIIEASNDLEALESLPDDLTTQAIDIANRMMMVYYRNKLRR